MLYNKKEIGFFEFFFLSLVLEKFCTYIGPLGYD